MSFLEVGGAQGTYIAVVILPWMPQEDQSCGKRGWSAVNSALTPPDLYSVLLRTGICWIPLLLDFSQWKVGTGKSPAGMGSSHRKSGSRRRGSEQVLLLQLSPGRTLVWQQLLLPTATGRGRWPRSLQSSSDSTSSPSPSGVLLLLAPGCFIILY